MLGIRSSLAVFRLAPSRGGALLKARRSQLLLRTPQTNPRSLSTNLSKRTFLRPRWRLNHGVLRRDVRANSNKAVAQESGSQAPTSISGRFKELSRKYGWAALGVYFGLSVLDFPFCFLAVRLIGPDRIGEVEHAIVDGFWSLVAAVFPSMGPEDRAKQKELADAEEREAPGSKARGHKDNASIWTQLLLAYGVHKSLIFFRVPLTAAVTPKVVKTLRSWGWNIGKPSKAVKSST